MHRFSFLVLFLLFQVFFTSLDNELFYLDKIMMVFGDARKLVEDKVKAITITHTAVESNVPSIYIEVA